MALKQEVPDTIKFSREKIIDEVQRGVVHVLWYLGEQ